MRIGDVFLTADLRLRVGEHTSAPLTSGNGLRLAEQLVRGSVRAAISEEEAVAMQARDRRSSTSRFTELSKKAKA